METRRWGLRGIRSLEFSDDGHTYELGNDGMCYGNDFGFREGEERERPREEMAMLRVIPTTPSLPTKTFLLYSGRLLSAFGIVVYIQICICLENRHQTGTIHQSFTHSHNYAFTPGFRRFHSAHTPLQTPRPSASIPAFKTRSPSAGTQSMTTPTPLSTSFLTSSVSRYPSSRHLQYVCNQMCMYRPTLSRSFFTGSLRCRSSFRRFATAEKAGEQSWLSSLPRAAA